MGCGCGRGLVAQPNAGIQPQKVSPGQVQMPAGLERWTMGSPLAVGHNSTVWELQLRDRAAEEPPFPVCLKVVKLRLDEKSGERRHTRDPGWQASSTQASTLDEVSCRPLGDDWSKSFTKDSLPFLDENKESKPRPAVGPAVHSTQRSSISRTSDALTASTTEVFDTYLGERTDFPERLASDKVKAQMLNEVSLMEEVRHPNVVGMLEWFQDDQAFYLVLQRCWGSIKQRHPKGMRQSLAGKYHCQLTSAVQHLHSMCILHSDIKPDHLMCQSSREDCDILLGDLGAALRLPDSEAFVQAPACTLLFAAPECLEHNVQYLASDIWSCGCVLFWMLRGECPFEVIWTEGIGRALRPGHASSKMDAEEWELLLCQLPRAICATEAMTKMASDKTKDKLVELVRGMLKVQPDCRMTADEVAAHPWTASASRRQLLPTHEEDSKPARDPSARRISQKGAQKAGGAKMASVVPSAEP